jgi:hypothetical protein
MVTIGSVHNIDSSSQSGKCGCGPVNDFADLAFEVAAHQGRVKGQIDRYLADQKGLSEEEKQKRTKAIQDYISCERTQIGKHQTKLEQLANAGTPKDRDRNAGTASKLREQFKELLKNLDKQSERMR